jgi:hypothetical protein
MANPQPDPDDRWPACDEQPPGVSIRPLGHGDLQALLAHLHQHEHDDEDEGLVAGSGERRPAGGGPRELEVPLTLEDRTLVLARFPLLRLPAWGWPGGGAAEPPPPPPSGRARGRR